jgi:hypothetical protein
MTSRVRVGHVYCGTYGPCYWRVYYARQAQAHDGLAREHEAAMRVLQSQGDTEGTEISRRAMDEERRSAQWDRLNAERDFWLSQF